MTAAERCQVNAVPASEDLGAPFRVTYRPCGKRADWYTEDARVDGHGVWLCDDHQREIAQRTDDDVAFEAVPR